MKESTIERLAYLIKNSKNKPIVFLGAGASKTGEIPLASEIVEDIISKYKDHPDIKESIEKGKTSYYELMSALYPFERNELLKGYIDKAKINVTHIYLAQMFKEGYVDYVLTVNFDNLMLRALALFNEFPPTYDMAILQDLTTSSFKEKSVIYLHGQHHGLWLLNTEEEMGKVNESIPAIFNQIGNMRTWIFVGYGGEDPILNYVSKLGRFDHCLFWVTHNDKQPCERVCKELLDKENTESYLIKGYDADSFMMRLNSELGLPQPFVINKPFSSLKQTLDNIVDIDDKEHFKNVKERLKTVKEQIDKAISLFEEGKTEELSSSSLKEEIDVDLLKKEIIDEIIDEKFEEKKIRQLEERVVHLGNSDINALMSDLYVTWGNNIDDIAGSKKDKKIFEKAFQKYKKSTEFNPNNDSAFNDWGISICSLATLKKDEKLFEEAIKKFEKALDLNPINGTILNNWGTAILELAKVEDNKKLIEEAIKKFEKAISLGGKHYNLACAYALLNDKDKALNTLDTSLRNKEIDIEFILKDDDWKEFLKNIDFKALIEKYRK